MRSFQGLAVHLRGTQGLGRWRPGPAVFVGVFLGLNLLLPVVCRGQPALANAVQTDRGIAVRQQQRQAAFAEAEGLEAGPVRLSVLALYSLEFTDNVNQSATDADSDVIQVPLLRLDLGVPISQRSDLTLALGVGYRSYWNTTERSQVTIAPDTELAYDVQIKQLLVTVFDRLSYTENIATLPDVAGQSQIPRLENTVGTQATWVPDRLLLAAGYSFNLYRSTDSEFDYINRDSHLPFVRGGYVFGQGAAQGGLEFSATFTDYQDATITDNTIVSFGPYMDWQLSDSFHAAVRGGLVYAVDGLSLAPDESLDADSFYAGLNLNHLLTETVNHSLDFSHGVRPSFERGADLTEETRVGYQVGWAFADPAALRFNLSYIHADQNFGSSFGGIEEVYEQWRTGVTLSYRFLDRLSGSIGYNFVIRDSNFPNRDYTENRVILGISYVLY